MKKALLCLLVLSGLPLAAWADAPGFTAFSISTISAGSPPVDPILSFDANDLWVNFNASSTDNVGANSGVLYTFDFTSTNSVAGSKFALTYFFPDASTAILTTSVDALGSTPFGPGTFTITANQISLDNSTFGWSGSQGFNGFEVSYVPPSVPDAGSTSSLLASAALALAGARFLGRRKSALAKS